MRSIARILAAGLLVVSVISGTAHGQANTFLKIDGIPGEATQDRHAGEIAIESLSFSVDQSGIRMAGGRGSPARSRFSVITVVKRVDKSSPLLFLKSALGEVIPSAVINVQKGGAQPVDFLTIKLTNVIVSSFSSSSSGAVFESIGLSFSAIEYTYRPQNSDGSLGAPITATFDVNRNKSVSAPAPE
ncbi:Hcp family type VI secretion system effector [Verrucomicrobiota bacterium sgz303538]